MNIEVRNVAIKSLEELRELRKSLQNTLKQRESAVGQNDQIELLVGMGTCGIAAGARDTYQALMDVTHQRGLDNVRIISVGCIGSCTMEPTVEIHMPGREALIYGKITKKRVAQLVDDVLINNGYLDDNLLIKSFQKAVT